MDVWDAWTIEDRGWRSILRLGGPAIRIVRRHPARIARADLVNPPIVNLKSSIQSSIITSPHRQ